MSGQFTPGAPQTEWCDRALLARIHRYTVKRLREEIEPVSTQDFMRFLLRWQHSCPTERRQGPDALDAVITQLQGFEAPGRGVGSGDCCPRGSTTTTSRGSTICASPAARCGRG